MTEVTIDGETYYLINPTEEFYPRLYLFIVCDHRMLVWARYIEDGLEAATAAVKEKWPGLLVGDEEHTELCRQACEDMGLAWPPPDDWCEDRRYLKAVALAEADLTYTESGWLTSYEWTVDGVYDGPLWDTVMSYKPCVQCDERHTVIVDSERYCDECFDELVGECLEELQWWLQEVADV